jgi:hypothetical protein
LFASDDDFLGAAADPERRDGRIDAALGGQLFR